MMTSQSSPKNTFNSSSTPNDQPIETYMTVDATAGFQNSGIFLKQGQRVVLEPEGRIHLAVAQIYNRAEYIKPLIIKHSPSGTFAENIQRQYSQLDLDDKSDKNIFNRNWMGPEGESVDSDFLNDCKLRTDLNWGTLLAIVMPKDNFSSQTDPFEVLKNQGELQTGQLLHVFKKKEDFVADRDGWLTFIINEAVNSQYSPSEKSRVYYEALKKAEQSLSGDYYHKIGSVPLVWFSDNVGAFRVKVTYSK
ncbi:hypothetical protein [Brasilonema sp. UFV-L1]|uniref:hypothetical protein n=1 Tax=Brasilonema sp. UFV-L1 TaxID=2234130 RepID=UPI00145FC5A7|nr:hypothetical protein [Brasilonema sp. UFV-L1]